MPKRLLLVEDDLDIRKNLELLLLSEGYEVLLADNGKEAIELLEKENQNLPHLILLDLMMPEMNGFEFRNYQMNSEKFSHIPAVVITAAGTLEENKIRDKVSRVLKKPLDIDLLLDVVVQYAL